MATMTQLRHLYGAATSARLGDTKSLRSTLDQFPDAIHWSVSDKQGGMSLLHLAAENKRHKAVKLLLSRGADPLFRNQRGSIPLAFALEENCEKSFDLLLPGSVPLINEFVAHTPDSTDKLQRPLWSALCSNIEHAIGAMVELGADPYLTAWQGNEATILEVGMCPPELQRAQRLLEAISKKQASALREETPQATRQGMRRTL